MSQMQSSPTCQPPISVNFLLSSCLPCHPLQLRFLGLLCMLFPHHSSTLMLYAVVISEKYTKHVTLINKNFLPHFPCGVRSFNFKLYSLLQPLLLVVSTRLAPHSEELVLGMETFLTIRNKKETTERERNTHRVKKVIREKTS